MIQGQEDPMQISTIGIDIGKNTFHFVGFDARGGIVVRRQCSRTQLVRALANLPPCLVGMEACCGAHHLGRILAAQGHGRRPAERLRRRSAGILRA
jgi:transposase